MREISRRSFLGTAAVLGAGRLLGAPGLAMAEAGALAAIDAFVNRHLRERGAPGMILGLADRDGVVATRTYGHRDIKTGQPVGADDLFEIGSITKSFIAISLLQLREAGKLDLDRPVREYLPWLRIESAYAPITVHHLLTHTSGLPNALTLPLHLAETPLWTGHAPGEHFRYCNLGYDILGRLLETLDGRPLLRHTGGMISFSSAMQADLDAGFGAFASVNASLAGYRPNPVAAYALAALRAESGGQALPPMPEPDDPYKQKNAADYAGTYTAPDGRTLVLTAEGDLLRLRFKSEYIPLERLAPDTFFVSHPDFALFALSFGRDEKGAVVEASYGPDWYVGERYAGPRTFEAPAEWTAFAGHYRNDSPWEGSARIALRNGRLWAGGDTPLVPLGGNLFRIGDEDFSPDRVRFGSLVNGRALVVTFNGVDYRRIET